MFPNPFNGRGNYNVKNIEGRLMKQEMRQEFWRGVVRGAIGATCFFAGFVATIYYVVQIIEAVK